MAKFTQNIYCSTLKIRVLHAPAFFEIIILRRDKSLKPMRWSSISYWRWITHFLFLWIPACLEIPSTQNSLLEVYLVSSEKSKWLQISHKLGLKNVKVRLIIHLHFLFLHQPGTKYFLFVQVLLAYLYLIDSFSLSETCDIVEMCKRKGFEL